MSSFKVPIILLLTFGFNAMFTAPHAPPPKEEIIESPASDVIPFRTFRFNIARLGQILLASVEIVTIVAQTVPDSGLSQRLLSLLSFRQPRHAMNLQMNSVAVIGAFLWLSGAALRVSAFRELGQFFRLDISIQKEHKLVVTGPYAYVRHPGYTGILLTTLGWFMWNGAKGSWARESGIWDMAIGRTIVIAYVLIAILPFSIVVLSRIPGENQVLRKKFGKEWQVWAKDVPYSVLPGIY